jgi:hypothetical protein
MTLNKTKVDKILTKKHKSPTWLAFKCGVTTSHLDHLYNGRRNASPELREKLITTLGDEDIFEGE